MKIINVAAAVLYNCTRVLHGRDERQGGKKKQQQMWPTKSGNYFFCFSFTSRGFCSSRIPIKLRIKEAWSVIHIRILKICFTWFFALCRPSQASWFGPRAPLWAAQVQPDSNRDVLKEHLVCVSRVRITTIRRDNCRPHVARWKFMNHGTGGGCCLSLFNFQLYCSERLKWEYDNKEKHQSNRRPLKRRTSPP